MSNDNELETIYESEEHEHCEAPTYYMEVEPMCYEPKIDHIEIFANLISNGMMSNDSELETINESEEYTQEKKEREPCKAPLSHIQPKTKIDVIAFFADLIKKRIISNDNELETIHESEEHEHHEAPTDYIEVEPMFHEPKIEANEISQTDSDIFDMSFLLVEACVDDQFNVAISDDVPVDQAVGDSKKNNEVKNDKSKNERIKRKSLSEGVMNQINLDKWYNYKQILERCLSKMKVSEHDMKTKSYDELCKMILPPMTLYRERNRFYRTRRDFNESLHDYLKCLKDLSETCQFGKRLDHEVADKFVTTLSDNIFYVFCTDGQTEIDLKTALEIATKNDDGAVHYSMPDLNYVPLSFPRMGRMKAKNKKVDSYMAEIIRNEIMEEGLCVEWDDIAGLDFPKSVIKESIVWPLRRPDIFKGLRKLPKGMLLFGLPGNGKTMIGKWIASQSKSTFFYVSADSLTSKWYGEGEKLVRALFAVAAEHQPSVIFFDEVDSLLTGRNKNDDESSRRMKTEFMIQLDGAATKDDDRVLLIAATNRPQDLDEAIRRRFVKRLYIPLPDVAARKQLLNILLKNECSNLSDSDINEIATSTNGFSGADIKWLCQDAAVEPLRSVSADRMIDVELKDIRPLELSDFVMSLKHVRPSVSNNDLTAMIEWDQLYGSNPDRPDYHEKHVMYS